MTRAGRPEHPRVSAMNKRHFLKTSGALLAGGMFARFVEADEQSAARTNWSGNYRFHAAHLDLPKTGEEVQSLVKSRSKVKALGARHSFNNIADSPGDQISLEHLDGITIDANARKVTVGGGVTYSQLSPYLDKHGWALHNLASLPHISVAGACATATHGSGIKNGNLSTAVSGLEMVNGKGEIVSCSREKHGDQFRGLVVALGALGIATKVTLDIQPTYQVRQVVYQNMSIDHLAHHLDEIFASGYSVSLFTDWQNHRITQVWIKSRVTPGEPFHPSPEFFGATLATKKLHPLADHSAEACTEQLGIAGPWYDRLPHFRIGATPSSGQELQTEYFVPREKGYEAILAVEKLRDHVTPHLFITELRTIAADDLWMSTCYQRAAMTIHFTWKPEWPAVQKVLPMIEEQLAPFDARPHWAKLFTMSPAVIKSRYAKLGSFQELLASYDPQGKFRNEYLNRNIYG